MIVAYGTAYRTAWRTSLLSNGFAVTSKPANATARVGSETTFRFGSFFSDGTSLSGMPSARSTLPDLISSSRCCASGITWNWTVFDWTGSQKFGFASSVQPEPTFQSFSVYGPDSAVCVFSQPCAVGSAAVACAFTVAGFMSAEP